MEPVPAPEFDWCSFYALFFSDTGIKCKINIPDTVLFRYGQLSAWWATNKEGYIQRHTSQSTSVEAIRKRFRQVASEDTSNYSKFVAISRLGDGKPQLLRVMAFDQLCELLSDRLESGHPDEAPEIETPNVLQAFIQPYQDLRYVTTYINTGRDVTCHTFQRKYSRRYTPMSAASAAQLDARDADIILAVDADGDARRAAIDAQQGAVEPGLKMQLRKLTAHLVNYIERAHGLTLGGVVCEYIRDADGKVYLLSVLRTEWSSNASGRGAGSLQAAALQMEPRDLDLVDPDLEEQEALVGTSPDAGSPQQVAAGTSNDGGGGAARPNIADQPKAAAMSFAQWSEAGTGAGLMGGGGVSNDGGSGGSGRPMTARPPSRAGEPLQPTAGGGNVRSSLTQFPGGNSHVGGSGMAMPNTWPSLQHEQSLAPASPSATIPRTSTLGGEHSGVYGGGTPSPAGFRSRSARPTSVASQSVSRTSLQRPTSSPAGHRSAVRSHSPTANPGGAPLGFGSTTHRSTHPSPDRTYTSKAAYGGSGSELPPMPSVGALTARGDHVNTGPRGMPLFVSQLQREVESLRDRLVYQHELAEANAAKVRQLEREKGVVTHTFDYRSNELQALLASTRDELAQTRAQCDSWQARAEAAEARVAELTQERDQLAGTVASDRGTTMAALREYQERDESNSKRIEQLESEVLRMSENLKMETTAVNSLKRQLLEFSVIAERHKATLRDADLDPSMVEVMDRTQHLLSQQSNPTGEQYSIQKILGHYHADLRAVFLFYAQLDQSFTDHWPPSMNFAQWMLFCKDSETSDTRAGARIRSNQHFRMMRPVDCENLFTKYSRPDESLMCRKADPVLTYESFLCALVHAAEKLRRPEVPYLSEGLREYVLRYLSKAQRVNPQGLKRGQVRHALGGVTDVTGSDSLATGLINTSTYMEPTSRSQANAASGAASRQLLGNTSGMSGGGGGGGGGGSGGCTRPQSAAMSGASSPGRRAGKKGNKSRPVSGASSTVSGAGGRPASPARVLHDAGNSAVLKELALLSLSGPLGNTGSVMRTGGGFNVP